MEDFVVFNFCFLSSKMVCEGYQLCQKIVCVTAVGSFIFF